MKRLWSSNMQVLRPPDFDKPGSFRVGGAFSVNLEGPCHLLFDLAATALASRQRSPQRPALVDQMVSQIPWDNVRTVVELGAGTGAVTDRILRSKPDHVRFLAFEKEPSFLARLQQNHPTGVEFHTEARQLARVLETKGMSKADVILSGLPFAVMPKERQEEILDQVQESLAPGGLFIAFQYFPFLYRRLRKRFTSVDVTFAVLNLPPAIVYRCTTHDG